VTKEQAKDNDPDLTEVGTIAGRAPAPVVPKPDADHAPSGSRGANQDRELSKEREKPADKD